MNKPALFLTALLLTACGTGSKQVTSTTTLNVTTEQLAVQPGTPVALRINAQGGVAWETLSLSLRYDPSQVEPLSLTAPDHITELQIIAPGQALVLVQRQGAPAPLVLELHKKTEGSAQVTIQATDLVTQDHSLTIQGGLTVASLGGAATPEQGQRQNDTISSQTLRTLPVPAHVSPTWAARSLGDLNLDGRVNLLDGRLLMQAMLGTVTLNDEQRYAADLKDDGRVSGEDLGALTVKLGLQTFGLQVPVLSVHPRTISTSGSAHGLVLAGNAGTGRLDSQASTAVSWLRLERQPAAGADVWSVKVQPGTPLGQTGEVQITSGGQHRRVNVKVTADLDTTQGQLTTFTINPREASGAVTVLSPFDEVSVEAVSIRAFVRQDASVITAKNANNEVVAMDVLTAGTQETAVFNAERSAVALVLTSPEMAGVQGPVRAQLAQKVYNHPDLAALVQTIRTQGRLYTSTAELNAAAAIARDLLTQSLQERNVSSQEVQEALAELMQAVSASTEVLGATPSFSLKKGLTTQKVECQFKFSTLLTVTQDGDDIKVTNRSPLAVNAYLVPANAKIDSFDDVLTNSVGMAYLSPPDPVTGIGVADWVIGLAGSRNDSFEKDDVRDQLKAKGFNPNTDKFKVVAVSTRLGGNDGNYFNTASTINVLSALNNFANVLGIGLEGKQIAKLAQGPAAQSILRAFNVAATTGDFGQAIKDMQEAKSAEERSEKLANLFTSTAGFFRENAELFTGLLKEAGSDFIKSASFTETIDDAVGRLTKGSVAKVATGANFAYAAASLGTLGKAWLNEQNGGYSQATVTDPGSDAEGSGCTPPPSPSPTPDPKPNPTPDPKPLPETPPEDAPDPDEGRGNGNGSGDGGAGETLPLPNEPGRASSFGDPHISTFEQQVYSFQAAGEFILSKSLEDSFQIQARYTPLGNMSANAAIAMWVGGDRVGLYASKTGVPRILVNGEPLNVVESERLFRPLAFGGTVAFDGVEAMVTWPDGSHLTAVLGQGMLGRVTVTVSPERAGRLTGLLGNFDGNINNDYQTRSGQTLAIPVPTPTLYHVFGESWRIQPEESLFDYASGETTYTFTDRNFPAGYAGLHSLSAAQLASAQSICRQTGILSEILLKKCTVDVGITGNPEWAYYSAGVDPNLPTVTVAPLTAQMLTDASREFGGIISGPQRFGNRELNWSVTGGKVTTLPEGGIRYTAPSEPGTYELTATSVVNPNLKKIVSIVVKAPAGTISGTTRFVLKWGETPADLDTHLWLPESMPYHVYYGRKGQDTECPNSSLDIDDTDGFGPEVIRVTRLAQTNGTYHVMAHNFSGSGTFASAGATMDVVDERGAVNLVKAPEGQGLWWHVLTIDAATGAINVVNTVGALNEPYVDTSEGCGPTPPSDVQLMRTPTTQSTKTSKPIWTPGVKRQR